MSILPGVRYLHMRTRFFPPATMDLEDQSPGAADLATRLLRPHVTVEIAGREVPVYSPYGPPRENYFNVLAVGLAAAATFAAILLWRGLRS